MDTYRHGALITEHNIMIEKQLRNGHDTENTSGTSANGFMPFQISRGHPLPLGMHRHHDGFNFALFSRHAEAVKLLIFEHINAAEPILVAELNPIYHRTGDIWHALIRGMDWNYAYLLHVSGPYAPTKGHRFDATRPVLDPYAYAISTVSAASPTTLNAAGETVDQLRCLIAEQTFDWQGTTRPKRAWNQTVIYETHVRGLTIHPSSAADHPGTFLGIVEKIGYFSDLGITALELMPVHSFDASLTTACDPITGKPLTNYWGYDTVGFFSPNEAYSTQEHNGAQIAEFKAMVRALHRAGIELILDVVFTHTAEGDENGPMFNFRGLDNAVYYILDRDSGIYRDFSGCGNTLNCNHPIVRDFIIDCLRYWVADMHVDGFRFDLASILGRDENGLLISNAPLLERIAEDPILRDVKLIAEAWDMGGAYQVGSFPGLRWAEWNGRFRDDIRRFWRNDPGMAALLATRICGSADLYQRSGKEPVNSINFVTCHDGFTLQDLVSYSEKHNEANGHQNKDGPEENYSSNYGTEGQTDDAHIDLIRLRQIKNMLATLLLSRGVPMILGGDEFRRTQCGNNNAYCQDNEISWIDWRLLVTHQGLYRFARLLLALRNHHPALTADSFYTNEEIDWFSPAGSSPDWNNQNNLLGCMIRPTPFIAGRSQSSALAIFFNATEETVVFRIPEAPNSRWRIAIDTAAYSPHDIFSIGEEPALRDEAFFYVLDRALVVLVST